MSALVLDAEVMSRLARTDARRPDGAVQVAIRAAANTGAEVLLPAAVLAELYRGGGHDRAVDACLARDDGISVVDTTRALARTVGNLLAATGRGSEHHVDATVVATAFAAGGGLILTSDVDDLGHLASATVGVEVRGL